MTAGGAPSDRRVIVRVFSHPAWRFIVPLGIMVLALALLKEQSKDINLVDVQAAARAYPVSVLAIGFAATFVSYFALSMYDVIIIRSVTDVKLPLAVPILTGLSSVALSNTLGFSWLWGGAVRYRVYSTFGIDISAVAKLIAMSWVAFFFGLLTLTGVLMVVHAKGLSEMTGLSDGAETVLGLLILATMAIYFTWTSKVRRSLGFGRFRLDLPLTRDGLKVTSISIVDLAASAITLYVLMPPDIAQNFVLFFVVFVAAVGLGILSHSPGGLGVFEAILIAGLAAAGRADVLAAMMMYRVIYSLVPFSIAIVGLAIAWALANRKTTSDAWGNVFKAITPVVPLVAAGLVMVSGVVLLVSGNLPIDQSRLNAFRDVLPLPVVETSHLLASVSGVLMLIVARGLFRRMFRAWLLACVLLGVGLALSLLKGFDWEEAVSLGLALVVLWTFRAAFYRADVSGLRVNWAWILSVSALVALISWIGFFAYSNIDYSDDLWWKFAWGGDASRFLRATLAVSVVLAAVMLNTLLSRQATRLRREPIPDVVRDLTAASCAAEAGISLSGDKRFIVTADARAYLAYADTGATLVSKGDPVGAMDAGIAAVWQLRELADKMGRRCAFYGVSERYLPTYLDLGLQILKIGEVARVDLRAFNLEGPTRKDWRYACGRVARDGYEFAVIKATDTGPVMDNLRAVSDAWLAHKDGREKGFSLGWFQPDYVSNFDIAVLRHADTGRIVAFANLMQAGDRSEVTLDLMRYDQEGPKVAMAALFAEMMLWAADEGFTWFSLGAAPLSGLETRRLAPAWHRLGSFVYEHGEQFYQFEGLRAFKQRFDPEWSPQYLASGSRLDAARVLYEVSLLISRGGGDVRSHGPEPLRHPPT